MCRRLAIGSQLGHAARGGVFRRGGAATLGTASALQTTATAEHVGFAGAKLAIEANLVTCDRKRVLFLALGCYVNSTASSDVLLLLRRRALMGLRGSAARLNCSSTNTEASSMGAYCPHVPWTYVTHA